MRYFYTARLLPIGKRVNIPDEKTGKPYFTTFNDKSFEIERTSKTKPEIWVNHNQAVRVGQVVMLYVSRAGWWECDFMLDPQLPNQLDVGQPMSVGLS